MTKRECYIIVLFLAAGLFLFLYLDTCTARFNVEWAKVILSIPAGIWALVVFNKNSHIKTIETLMALEKDYRRHLPFLLDIETNYKRLIQPVLKRELLDRNLDLIPTEHDKEILRKLDGVLRHYSICSKANKEGVIGKDLVDSAYKYYLAMLTDMTWIRSDGSTGPDGIPRKELGEYVKLYWPSIYESSMTLGKPRQYIEAETSR